MNPFARMLAVRWSVRNAARMLILAALLSLVVLAVFGPVVGNVVMLGLAVLVLSNAQDGAMRGLAWLFIACFVAGPVLAAADAVS